MPFLPDSGNAGLAFLICRTPLLNLRSDVLVQGKEVRRVVFFLDGNEPLVVETERGLYRIFSFLLAFQILRAFS